MAVYYSPDNGAYSPPQGKAKLKWRCPKCACVNSLAVKFCGRCHTRLGDDALEEGEKVGKGDQHS